ncbi:HAD-IA family hydrolase [Pseudopelagicola sp. nBUS_19]|uniref:HAD-IA family hydrolase n=1 Tax=Pseudopelagicola sp. nBUS_19 TaxID=3395316 RepID=UPI003EB8CBD1
MTELKLVVFDVDGTLVDSQADILGAMSFAFDQVGLKLPDRDTVLGIVGLSLDVAFARLVPDASVSIRNKLVDAYKGSYRRGRVEKGTSLPSPLYPGARDALKHLSGVDEIFLGVATGKSRRGLNKFFEGHGLEGVFQTQQVSDHHPSKPHPSMLLTALEEVGVEAGSAVMVGDTSFDMDMAKAAGMAAIGVSWGYHKASALTSADIVIDEFHDLRDVLVDMWS